MGSAANAHGRELLIGGEAGLVQTFSIANGLSVSRFSAPVPGSASR
jgi:hypothetical protein